MQDGIRHVCHALMSQSHLLWNGSCQVSSLCPTAHERVRVSDKRQCLQGTRCLTQYAPGAGTMPCV